MSNAISAGTSVNAVLSGVTVGHKAIVGVSQSGAGTLSTMQDGSANALTQFVTNKNATANNTVWGFFYDFVATAPTLTFTCTGTADLSIIVTEFSGLLAGNTTACLDGTAVGLSGGTSPTGDPTYSDTVASELLIALFADWGAGVTMTQPTGYTLDTNSINASGNSDLGLAYKNSAGGSETTASSGWTTSGADQWSIGVVAFKLAATSVIPNVNMAVQRAA